jgi:predicted GNAT family acetyltransferase
MASDAVAALAHAIADSGVLLPGVSGEAATAASFAGNWTERRKSGAVPVSGFRIYEMGELKEIETVEGNLRRAASADRDLMIRWVTAFHEEIHEAASNVERVVDTRLLNGQLWIWECPAPASMAVSVKPVAGVTRIAGVYTPPENRRRGYAAACVHTLSRLELDAGRRCILYTDLGNPTSNSIYRRIGYRAVAEVLRYRFDARS